MKTTNGDSAHYTINGKKAKESEFKKLEPNQLQSIRIVDDSGKDPDAKTISIVTKSTTPVGMVRVKGTKDTIKNTVHFNYNANKDTVRILTFNVVNNANTNISSNSGNQKFEDVVLISPDNYTDFNDKLILIDGKEATAKALKKLPAYDIESMGVNKSNAMVDKYGDKAKNGVIFITTKKGKK